MSNSPIIISACLLGIKCRFDGASALDDKLAEELSTKHTAFIPVCPEQLGGLPTPRPRAGITTGTGADVLNGQSPVIDSRDADVTENFIEGAKETLKIARLMGAKKAILKEGSPSCGLKFIKRAGEERPGPGVTAALLIKENIKVEGR